MSSLRLQFDQLLSSHDVELKNTLRHIVRTLNRELLARRRKKTLAIKMYRVYSDRRALRDTKI